MTQTSEPLNPPLAPPLRREPWVELIDVLHMRCVTYEVCHMCQVDYALVCMGLVVSRNTSVGKCLAKM
jgi:hypothetical protein